MYKLPTSGSQSAKSHGWLRCCMLIGLFTFMTGCQSLRSRFLTASPSDNVTSTAASPAVDDQPGSQARALAQQTASEEATAEHSFGAQVDEQHRASKIQQRQEPLAEVITVAHQQPVAATVASSVDTASYSPQEDSAGDVDPQRHSAEASSSVAMTAAPVGHSAVSSQVMHDASRQAFVDAVSSSDPNCFPMTAACVPDCGGCMTCQPAVPEPPCRNAQEYIFDGGDQLPTVVVRKDGSTAGIDPTDTVVYYETDNGTLCVLPSNRVPIYAPRFGAVRQVTGAFLAAKAIGTQRILAPVQPGRLEDVNPPTTVMQPVAPVGEEQVRLIDAFRENVAGTPIASVIPPERISDALIPHEGIDVLRTGRITDEEILVMGRILQNARTWFVPESLGVIVEGQEAHLMIGAKKPQDVHVFDIPDKCTLRICKTASHTIANSGDIVNFTIRFDNVGAKPVRNIVIVDSLSPRLEYIEGSQQSSVETRFSANPNDVGSEELRWEIDVIDKVDGGVISFDCRVR